MKIRNIIFDLDGTLLNTLTDLYLSVNFALNKFSYPTKTKEEIRTFVGNGIRQLVIRSVPHGEDNPDFERIFETFKTYYKDNSMNNTLPYAGIEELLNELKNRNINLAIVSNKADFAVSDLNEKFFNDYITVALGEVSDLPRKPQPHLIFKAMEKINATENDTVYIGDSEVDILTAENANLPCILALWGFRTEDELLKAGGKYFAKTPLDILNYIEKNSF